MLKQELVKVKGRINHTAPAEFLIDSGSTDNVITWLHAKVPVKRSEVEFLKSAAGTLMDVLGESDVKIQIGEWKGVIKALVVCHLPCDLVLGVKFLTEYQAVIDFSDMQLTLHNGENKICSVPFGRKTVLEAIVADRRFMPAEEKQEKDFKINLFNELPLEQETINKNSLMKIRIKDKIIVKPQKSVECEAFAVGNLALMNLIPNFNFLLKKSAGHGQSY